MALADTLADHPAKETFDLAELNRAAQAAAACALACSACVDSDLARGETDCVPTCLDCADVCSIVAKMLARPTPRGDAWQKLVTACAAMCAQCAEHCSNHDRVCCQQCAEACRECEQACQQLLAAAQR